MVHPSWNDFPNLLAELDWSKNKKLRLRDKIVTPDQLPVGTGKWLDWRCSTCSHEWRALGSNRRKGTGCPACKGSLHSDGRNSMANTHPELAKEYLGDPNKITAGIYKKLDWRCSTCSHEWKTLGTVRKNGSGCPVCTNRTIHSDGRNSMTYTHPELAKEYLGDASKIIAGTHKILQWRCSVCEHEWSLGGNQRTSKKSGCPACNGGLHSHGRNSMANTHPELAKEYLGDANKITASTSKKLDWRCSVCEHEWKAIGSSRGKIGRGCPACANQAIHSDGRNSMAKTHPELAKEYLGDANKVIAGTNKYLDWRCSDCENQWKASGNNRAYHDRGCAACAKYGYNPEMIGYLYIHHYSDENDNWLKCGITNFPDDRIKSLRKSANKFNLDIIEIEMYKFDDGAIPRLCEKEIMKMADIRFDSNYDIDGKNEFFNYDALGIIKNYILKWL